MSPLNNFLVVSELDSTAEIKYNLFSAPLFQTTYFQTQHAVSLLVYMLE